MEYVSYDSFAYVYDELMDNVPYLEWSDTIAKVIEEYGISSKTHGIKSWDDDAKAKSGEEELTDTTVDMDLADYDSPLLQSEKNLVLDLGCGTGTFTEIMYEKGYDMIGVDLSGQMLEVAENKRFEKNYDILYLNQDMRELDLYSTVGTVISVCDSVNYLLSDEDVLKTFSLVNKFLFPKGLFIFDFNTSYKYREVIGDTVIAENRENCSFIWENYYDEDEGINEYDLTIFVKDDEDDIYYKNCETHFQKGYTAEEICNFLTRTNFEIIKAIDSDNGQEVCASTERVFVVARKF